MGRGPWSRRLAFSLGCDRQLAFDRTLEGLGVFDFSGFSPPAQTGALRSLSCNSWPYQVRQRATHCIPAPVVCVVPSMSPAAKSNYSW